MNKKLIYIFVVLVVGLFVASACNIIEQDAVGRRVMNRNFVDDRIIPNGDKPRHSRKQKF